MKYHIYNPEDAEHYYSTGKTIQELVEWIENHLDLSKNWTIESLETGKDESK